MWTNLLLVVGVLAVVTVACLLTRAYDGRFRPARDANPANPASPVGTVESGEHGEHTPGPSAGVPAAEPVLTEVDLGQPLGDRATLVQFSSAFCAPCRATRTLLADVATAVPGVRHIEIDAESHLELVRRLRVVRTPTTFVVDARGRVRTRASGVARRGAVVAALDAALDHPAGGPTGQ